MYRIYISIVNSLVFPVLDTALYAILMQHLLIRKLTNETAQK